MSFTQTIKGKLVFAFSLIAILTAANSALGLFFTNSVGERGLEVGERLAPLVHAADKIQVEAAKAHLLLEEIMGGDQTEDIAEVWQLLDRSLWYANAILDGGENESGHFYAAESPEVRSKIEAVRQAIIEFTAVARERHENYLSRSNAGTTGDTQFDVVYEDAISSIDRFVGQTATDRTNYMTVVRSAAEAKYLLANAHLDLEERLAGAHGVQFGAIRRGARGGKGQHGEASPRRDDR